MPARPICIAHAAHGFAGLASAYVARDCAALCVRAHQSGHRSWAHVVAWPPTALLWWRWSKGRRSSIHGGEPTRRASGWRRQLTVASCRREGWKNQDGGGVLRRGGGSGGRRGPASGWRGSSSSSVPGEKSGKGGGCSGLHSLWRGSRRRRRLDSSGDALGQRRGRLWTRETARSGRARTRRRLQTRPVGNGQSERLLTCLGASGHHHPR
jgi:hypothetical protein